MKNLKNIISVLLITLSLISFKATAQISKVEIRAMGLTCSMCSNAINKQLESIPEVISVETDLNTNTFVVTLIDSNTLSPKIFKDKVERAGFSIGSIIITASSKTVSDDQYIALDTINKVDTTVKFQVLDKGYLTLKEFKKKVKMYKKVQTFDVENENDFHIKFL